MDRRLFLGLTTAAGAAGSLGPGPARAPLTTLKSFREVGGGVLFGQDLAVDGRGRLEVGMPVEILD